MIVTCESYYTIIKKKRQNVLKIIWNFWYNISNFQKTSLGGRNICGQSFENFPAADEMRHMIPLDCIAGFDVRPGFYIYEGATPIPNGVNFTVHSHGATSCELLLYHRMAEQPVCGASVS